MNRASTNSKRNTEPREEALAYILDTNKKVTFTKETGKESVLSSTHQMLSAKTYVHANAIQIRDEDDEQRYSVLISLITWHIKKGNDTTKWNQIYRTTDYLVDNCAHHHYAKGEAKRQSIVIRNKCHWAHDRFKETCQNGIRVTQETIITPTQLRTNSTQKRNEKEGTIIKSKFQWAHVNLQRNMR